MSTAKKIQINPASEASLSDYETKDYSAAPVHRAEHLEDTFTMLLEQQTAKIPSSVFLAVAMVSIVSSLALELRGRRRESHFVGLWPPVFLMLGLYNKLVKLGGIH